METNDVTGSFVWDLRTDKWLWSRDLFLLHGLDPLVTEPSTELFRAHQHEEDQKTVNEAIEQALEDGEPFHCGYRLIDADNEQHPVVMVGMAEFDHDGRPEHLSGYIMELDADTASFEPTHAYLREQVEHAWAAFSSHTVIERTKGMIMLACGCDADTAWDTMARISQRTNLKVRDIASSVSAAIAGEETPDLNAPQRHTVLREILATRQRVKGESVSEN